MALVHCTKQTNFPRKKNYFFATRKDVVSYSQITGKRILALEFSHFSGGGPNNELVCALFRGTSDFDG
jgi:hypothetical protein